MHARFLLGPAGSGKTFRCLAEIRAELARSPAGPPLLLLAPKQATFQLERELLADASLSGYTRLQILSFERLAEFILSELADTAPRLLDEEGRVMVLRALLAQLHKQLKIFHATARLPGFAQQLSLLLRELQRHQLLDRKLAALARHGDMPATLGNKLHDFALLLRAYLDWLAANQLQDANCLLDVATALLRSSHQPSTINYQLQISGLWLDGFAEMTPQEIDFLAALVPLCERATLAFCLDGEPADKTSWLSPWAVVGKTFRNCHQRLAALPDCKVEIENLPRSAAHGRFAASPELAHLEASWTLPASILPPSLRYGATSNSPSSLSLFACANPEAEAILAAREIRRHVRAGGRYRDCAALLRSLDGYHHELRRVFQRYEIPFFLDRREPVAHHPLAELTRYALRTAAFDWAHDDWFGALKTGLVPVVETEIDWLENTALEFGWAGDIWKKPFLLPDKPAIADRAEALRRKIFPPFAALAQKTAALLTGNQLAAALQNFWAELDVQTTLDTWNETAASPVHSTVWDQLQKWLANLALAFPTTSLALRDWLPILEAGLANLSIGVIPPALDQVVIGAIDRSRSPNVKLVLILGLNEGVFPQPPNPTGLLTESDRAALENCGAFLGAGKFTQLGHERYYGYIACTRASERLALTCAQSDSRDRALNPSPFIAHLQRIFPALEMQTAAPTEYWLTAEHPSELAPTLIKFPDTAVRLQIPALTQLAENLRQLRQPSPTENLSPALAAKLYGPVFHTSVSAIERFATCPFQFFMRSGLRAEERKLFEADARERGSFQHEVLRRFHETVRAQNNQWRDLTPAAARQLIGEIAARVATEFRDGLFRTSPESAFAARSLTAALQDFIEIIIGWMPDYGFDPRAVELSFGFPDDQLPAWKMDLGDGQQMAFRGKIDRVDVATGGAEFVVIDYKSGGKKIDPLLLENGVQIQLPAYLAALRQVAAASEMFNRTPLQPVGAFYVNLRGDYPTGASRAEVLAEADDARRRAYRHTGRFSLAVLPQLDHKFPAANSGQFSYAMTKAGKPNKTSKDLLEPAEFAALLDDVEKILRAMGRRIFAGEAAVDPYRKGSETPCAYCECRAICRIDPWTHEFRALKKSSVGENS
jgi:ATP-dependent helicase/nuclease subunit B